MKSKIHEIQNLIYMLQCVFDKHAQTLILRHSSFRRSTGEPGSGGYLVSWEILDFSNMDLPTPATPRTPATSLTGQQNEMSLEFCETELGVIRLLESLLPETVKVEKYGEVEIRINREFDDHRSTFPFLLFLSSQRFILSSLSYELELDIDGSLTEMFEFPMTRKGPAWNSSDNIWINVPSTFVQCVSLDPPVHRMRPK